MSDDKDPRFDIYHFFSRKDVILAAIVVILLLLWTLWEHFKAGAA